jgi:hypothetical protein
MKAAPTAMNVLCPELPTARKITPRVKNTEPGVRERGSAVVGLPVIRRTSY